MSVAETKSGQTASQIKYKPGLYKPVSKLPFNGTNNKGFSKDTVSFGAAQNNSVPSRHLNILSKLSFLGPKATKKDVENYLEDLDKYTTTADVHNMILGSYVDQRVAGPVVASECQRKGLSRDQFFTEAVDNMFKFFDKLKLSNVIVIEGANPVNFDVLNEEKYAQVRRVYNSILERPETFDTLRYDSTKEQLITLLKPEQVKEKSENLRHILDDILPEIIKAKTFVMKDPSDLHKLLSDEVVQALILEKLDLEAESKKPDTDDHDHDKHDIAFGCGGHKNHVHDPKPKPKPDHDHDHDHHELTPEEKLNSAMELLKDINEKFDITMVSKVPTRWWDPLGKEKETPPNYYDKSMLGLRNTPKNFYEAQYLNKVAKNINGYDPKNTVMVTPKGAANDIIEKVKALNKDYLYIEDWLYRYCLGDQVTKDQIIKDLEKVACHDTQNQFKQLAKDLDKYVNEFLKVYDLEHPENDAKLTGALKDYNRVTCMSELSRGYFMGVGEDAKDLVKMLFGLALFGEVAHHAAEGLGAGIVMNLANTAIGVTDSMSSACTNYLQWKHELGEEKAKENFNKVVNNVMTFAIPMLFTRLDEEHGGVMQHLIFRNASAVDAYSGVIATYTEYYAKLEELLEKGIKKIPEDIKDDPKQVTKWKLTEAWRAFAGHALNRGQAMGLVISQPFAIAAPAMMTVLGPVGGGGLIIAVAGMLECLTSNIYMLLDAKMWANFKKDLKESLAEQEKIEMTPERFLELRKSLLTKAVESSPMQATLGVGIEVKDHLPEGTGSAIKKAYNAVTNVVGNTIAKPFKYFLIKYLDRKYDRMSKEERDKIEGDSCCGSGAAH